MLIAYVVFGLVFIAGGIWELAKDEGHTWGWVGIAIGVGYVLVAAFRWKRQGAHPKSEV
jgi:hypothetical protein